MRLLGKIGLFVFMSVMGANLVQADEYIQAEDGYQWQFPGKVATFTKKYCGKDVKYCVGFKKMKTTAGYLVSSMVACRANSKGDCPVSAENCGENDSTIAFSRGRVAAASDGGTPNGGGGGSSSGTLNNNAGGEGAR